MLPYATRVGDLLTLHNVRDFDYRTEQDFEVRYDDCTFDPARLDAVDLIAVYWAGDAIAHIMVSFGFVHRADQSAERRAGVLQHADHQLHHRRLADRARAVRPLPLDWRVLLSGYFPEYVYDLGSLDTRLPFSGAEGADSDQ